MIKKFNEFVNESRKDKPTPKFKKGDRCCFMYPVGKGKNKNIECIDNDMVIEDEPFWNEERNQWSYPIVGRANPCEEYFLELYDESMNESFKVTPDDYSYFRRQILGSREPDSELINGLIDNREEYVQMLMRTAKSHWELGDGKRSEFPEKEYFKIIDEVIDEIISER